MTQALLALEDGRAFPCRSFTGPGEAWGEVVFNTSMTGYQEVLTDPSYRGQMVAMTYPLVGNYGVNPEDVESNRVQVAAFIVREYQEFPSNHRATSSLADYLRDNGVAGIHELDTRALTRHIRTAGAMRGMISTEELDPAALVRKVRETPSLVGRDLVREVTADAPYRWRDGKRLPLSADEPLDETVWQGDSERFRVVAMDFGVKYNILRCLEEEGAQIVVVPAGTDAETVRAMSPDGIFLSNGPGDPEPVDYAVGTIQSLLGYRPMFGICLGQQLAGLALGGKTFKLKFGHRGANQPVQNLENGRIEITSQNHGFSVDTDSLPAGEVEITHMNLNDRTLEGLRHRKYPLFTVQYHPEASPGPHDARYLFEEFRRRMSEYR
ncbi:MAG: glutamine-hydrolyzing carbamoyl-phosphate synthase small subunit [Desulfococcaceae bacterium]